jgi:hypothetical protein
MALFPLGILSAAGAGGGAAASDYELIESFILSSNQASIVFSNLGNFSSTYKHLQIRAVLRNTTASNAGQVRLNGDTGANYTYHDLAGSGTGVGSAGAANETQHLFYGVTGSSQSTGNFGVAVIDILDSFSTTKNKTIRTFAGSTQANRIGLNSAVWRNTNSITSINVFSPSTFLTGSRVSLYGVKG